MKYMESTARDSFSCWMHHSTTLAKYNHLTATCKIAAQVRQILLCLDSTWICSFSIKKKKQCMHLSSIVFLKL